MKLMPFEQFVEQHPEFNNAQLFEYIRKKNIKVKFYRTRLLDLINNETHSVNRIDDLVAYMVDRGLQQYIEWI
ncbi:hypothetical protein [Paucilactobacillus sp. N302-9]